MWGKFWGPTYWGDGYWGPAGYTFQPTGNSPQTVQIVITITAVPETPQPGIGHGRVLLVPWGRPGIYVIGQIPPPT